MKTFVWGMFLAFVPPSLQTVLADVGNGEECERKVIVVAKALAGDGADVAVADGAEGEGEVRVMAIVGTGEGEPAAVTATADGRSEPHVVRVKRVLAPDAEGKERGWLGVLVQPVPEALAAQLETEGRGLMVANVTKDSPADRAGLQAHDVIVSVAGTEMNGGAQQLASLIGDTKPGETVEIVLLRQGQEQTLKVQLGSRADAGAMEWKFDTGPLGEIEEKVRTRGKFLGRGPNGEWTITDLGDLDELDDLPDNIRMFLPRSGSRSAQVTVNNNRKTLRINVERDGSALVVEQEDDGPITVRRTDAAGTESTATYNTEEELRVGDAEAYEAFSDVHHDVVVTDSDGVADIDIDVDLHGLHEGMAKVHEALKEGLGQAGEARAQAMEELHKAMQQWKGGAHRFVWHGKARQTIEVRPDGQIEVRTRKGDSELVQLYANEADLQTRAPDAYQKYQELLRGEE
ncbi:MAG: PDZ domain-containing protein [Planctomycetes bacterium]|nr:PDZ domain-containing protein [Planctomycetota bacterium]